MVNFALKTVALVTKALAMLPPAVKHQPPVMPFDCSGESTNTVNKSIGVSCFGDIVTCDVAICCETSATCHVFGCSGYLTDTVNKGIDVS